jgi:hypothetical protein
MGDFLSAGCDAKHDNEGGVMRTVWEHFESLVLQFLEDRTCELLTQGDVASDPKLIARIRESAAWAADRAVARFIAAEGVQKLGKKRIDS